MPSQNLFLEYVAYSIFSKSVYSASFSRMRHIWKFGDISFWLNPSPALSTFISFSQNPLPSWATSFVNGPLVYGLDEPSIPVKCRSWGVQKLVFFFLSLASILSLYTCKVNRSFFDHYFFFKVLEAHAIWNFSKV